MCFLLAVINKSVKVPFKVFCCGRMAGDTVKKIFFLNFCVNLRGFTLVSQAAIGDSSYTCI